MMRSPRMKGITLLLACCLWLLPVVAHADVAALLSDYDSRKQPDRGLATMMIIGIAEGFDAVNDELKKEGGTALFCSPVKLKADQLMEILRKWIDTNRAKSPRIETAP